MYDDRAQNQNTQPPVKKRRLHSPRVKSSKDDLDDGLGSSFKPPISRVAYDFVSPEPNSKQNATTKLNTPDLLSSRRANRAPWADFGPSCALSPKAVHIRQTEQRGTGCLTPLRPLNLKPPAIRTPLESKRTLSGGRPLYPPAQKALTTYTPRTFRPFTDLELASPLAKLKHAPDLPSSHTKPPELVHSHASLRPIRPPVLFTPCKAGLDPLTSRLPLFVHKSPALPTKPIDMKVLPLFVENDSELCDSHATRADALVRSGRKGRSLTPRLPATDKALMPHIDNFAHFAPPTPPRNIMQSEFVRGLDMSPEKGGRERGPKYVRGGLAERAAHLLARSKTSFSLWNTELEQHYPRYPRPDLRFHILAIRTLTRSPAAITTCRDVEHGHEGTVVFRFVGNVVAGFAEGRDVAVWWPWHEIDMPDSVDLVQHPNLDKDASVEKRTTALLCSRFLVLPEIDVQS